MLQNLCSNGESWRRNNVFIKDIDEYMIKYMNNDRLLYNLYKILRKEALDKGLIR